MERKIGEIFKYNSEWYQCLKSHGDICDGCAGYWSDYVCNSLGNCEGKIFKKLEKVGQPYYSSYYKQVLQEYKYYTSPIISDTRVHILKVGIVRIEIKQNKEDMKEIYKAEDTLLTRLVGRYVNNLIDYTTFERAVKELYSDKEEHKPTSKEFDLEAAKAGKPVCTRDGRKARIICFDSNGGRPIVALVTECDDEEEIPYKYHCDGSYNCQSIPSDNDLMMLPEKKEGWVNIYRSQIYDTLERAEEAYKRTCNDDNYLQTIKIEWEE